MCEKQLEGIDNPPIEYEGNGKTYTQYEASQRQRAIERAIRDEKRKMAGFAESPANKMDFENSAIKMQMLKQEYRKFSSAANLPLRLDKQQVYGFGRSPAQKAVWAVRKNANRDIINNTKPLLARIPNATAASTTKAKIQGYLLNSNHKVGGDKAKVINTVLGYHYENWNVLADKIYYAVQNSPVVDIKKTQFGIKYETHMTVKGEKSRSLVLRTVWQFDNGSQIPRLITITFNKRKGIR